MQLHATSTTHHYYLRNLASNGHEFPTQESTERNNISGFHVSCIYSPLLAKPYLTVMEEVIISANSKDSIQAVTEKRQLYCTNHPPEL